MKRSNSLKGPRTPGSLLSDECVPEIVNRFLENNRVKVCRADDLKLTAKPDEIVFEKASQLKIPVITLDIRFAGQVYRQQSYSNGLILLRYKGKVTNNLLISIKKILNEIKLNRIQNCIVVIDKVKYRIKQGKFLTI